MSEQELQIAVCEELGWSEIHYFDDQKSVPMWTGIPPDKLTVDSDGDWGISRSKYHRPLTPLTLDLMHEAEETLTAQERNAYCRQLSWEIFKQPMITGWSFAHAAAIQRATAFIAVKRKGKV